jgi:signal transduction histidine kinase
VTASDAISPTADSTDDCLAGGGEAGALMRAIDWSQNPLGPVRDWSRSLKTFVRAVLDSRFGMRILWGPEMIFLYNDAYRPVLGATKHPSAMGARTADIYREIWPIVGPMFEKGYRGEATALDDLLLLLDRNGYVEECYFTLSYSPIRDEDGSVGGVLGVVHETTERVLAERRLNTLRELASSASKANSAEIACQSAAQTLERSAADLPFVVFYLVDDDGRSARLVATAGIAAGGPATPATVDLSSGIAEGWPFSRVAATLASETVGDVRARFGDIHAGPYPEPVSTAVVLPLARPGLERPYGFFIAGVSPRRAVDEKYHAFFELTSEHIVTAISNATAYQQERRRAEALAAIDRQKTAFFNNVSHEFRTPLTLMLGPLADALASPERALTGSHLVSAHRNALRLLKLVNSLLEFSRLEAGRVQASYQPTDLAAMTREMASAFDGLAKRAGLRLEIECVPLDEPAYVDREMWEKIVLNLLSNAFKFTFDGSIRVTLEAVAGFAELRVRDTGVGIPEGELAHLFERFHRIEGTRARTHEGSGIGLALVQEHAKLHGGSVHAESELGRGSAFVVRVPLGTSHLPEGWTARDSRSTPPALGIAPFLEEASRWISDGPDSADPLDEMPVVSAEARGARVLLVDDSADMREYVGGVLARYFTVDSASDGEVALRKMQAIVPDLVLTDVMMPNLDGVGLLRAIRADARTRSVPVILLSARAGEEARVDGLNAGADDYLTKPFSARELVARVRTHIELGRLRARAEGERRAAAELERERLYDLFMQAPAAICVLQGPEHVYELANPPYIELIGGRAILGKPIRVALPEVVPVVLPVLDRVYETGEPFFGNEFPIPVERNGVVRELVFNFVYKPVVDASGRVERIMVVASEVTEQVRSRVVAERLSDALAASNRELDQFAYVASHDLKAPLRGIANLSQWIEEGLAGKMDGETKRQMEMLRGRVRRLDALIDGILSYSRAGRARDRIEPVDVGALLVETRELLSPRPEAAISLGDGMPVLDAERVPLQQVFLNLMSNALKHAQRADARVSVTCDDEGGFYHFRVADNGPGIAPEYHERIWTLFTTLRARDEVEGTGIGLSVVKKIVETRGGRVAVESAAGAGATFHVHWPKHST